MTAASPEALVGLDESWEHPSPRLRTMRRVQVGAVAGVAAMAAFAIGAGLGANGTGGIAAGAFLVAGALVGWFVERRVRAWAYCERADDLLVRRGL
ncbi:MAG: PH domain-containing protein, partial [Gaiellaceae bacterium]